MTTLILCLFIAAILPYLAKAPVAYAMSKLGKYDNKHPRQQQSQLTDFGARALAAHQNAFESLILFSAAIATALATNTHGELIQQLAMTHIVARIAYNLLYLFNIDKMRSMVWAISLICSLTIIWQCLP
jgi:uncharacterized MAPEG superfamily protein